VIGGEKSGRRAESSLSLDPIGKPLIAVGGGGVLTMFAG
jgi:hypothetical protein